MDPVLLQKQVRDNSEELRTYLKELSSWEDEMKRKECSIKEKNSEPEVPAVRPKIIKIDSGTKQTKDKKPPEKIERIKGYDYKAWDKFDVDAECEKLDNEKPKEKSESESSDSEDFDATEEYQTRLRDEATYEKERGNQFVKQQKWSEAISCYTHAISCYPKDPIFFANRALCYLKKNDLYSAEADCTSALQFDPNYVKALQRRAAARIDLKQTNEAINDLKKVLEIEPNNKDSKKELEKLEKMLGTSKKESKSETSKYIAPQLKKEEKIESSKNIVLQPIKDEKKSEIKFIPPKETEVVKQVPSEEKTVEQPEIKILWPPRPNAIPIKPIQKAPHLRSKTPLHTIKIREIDGIKQTIQDIDKPSGSGLQKNLSVKNNADKKVLVEDLGHLHIEKDKLNNKNNETTNFNYPVPKTSVQFYLHWKLMEKNKDHKYLYLKQINPEDIPNIFQEAMESDVYGDILNILADKFIEQNLDVFQYLKYLSNVKRFSALVMFMSNADKTALKKLFESCSKKNLSEELDKLRKKYEI